MKLVVQMQKLGGNFVTVTFPAFKVRLVLLLHNIHSLSQLNKQYINKWNTFKADCSIVVVEFKILSCLILLCPSSPTHFPSLSWFIVVFIFYYFSIFPSDRIISWLASGVQVIARSWEWNGNVFQAVFCRGEVKALKHIETAQSNTHTRRLTAPFMMNGHEFFPSVSPPVK